MKRPKFYVYALIDPRTMMPFYIGKGTGRRMYQHLSDARLAKDINPAKESRIRQIEKAGLSVICQEIAYFWSEPDAYAFEAEMIGSHDGLTNIAGKPPNYEAMPLNTLFDRLLFSYAPELALNAAETKVLNLRKHRYVWALLVACAAKTRGLKANRVSSEILNGSITWQHAKTANIPAPR